MTISLTRDDVCYKRHRQLTTDRERVFRCDWRALRASGIRSPPKIGNQLREVADEADATESARRTDAEQRVGNIRGRTAPPVAPVDEPGDEQACSQPWNRQPIAIGVIDGSKQLP